MAESTKTLSDDAVREILLRLDDVATLFRCAAACKSWRRLVAEPSFLIRRRWPRSLVVGYFTQRCRGTKFPGTSPTNSNSQLAFVPLPGPSLLGTRRRPLSSFFPADDVAAAVVDRALPLATRGGLLVVRLYPHDDDLQPNIVRLAVCSPLAGTWDVLPELDCNTMFACSDDYNCDILPSSGAGHNRPAFRVLMIGGDKDESQFNLHTYVSGDASWREPTKCFNKMERQIWSMVHDGAFLCRGYAHWLFVSETNFFHLLNLNIETGRLSLTKLLCPTKENVFLLAMDPTYDFATRRENLKRALRELSCANRLTAAADGTLSLCVYRGRRLEIWTPQQEEGHQSGDGDGDVEWTRTRLVDHRLTELIQLLQRPACIWLGEKSATLLVKDYHDQRIYNANLDIGTLEEVTDQFHDHARSTIMPMEIDWPTFFMLRLGSLS